MAGTEGPVGPRLLEIEDRLAADATGAERDAVLARLQAARAAAKRNLDRGLPPPQAMRWKSLLAALDAGEAVVRRVWAHLHRSGV
jgi:type III secretion system YseE family protein